MAKKYDSKHNGMDVSISMDDTDDLDFKVSTSDVPELSGGGKFTLLKEIADIRFDYKAKKDHASDKYKKITFKGHIVFEISFTDEVVSALEAKGKSVENLELGYFMEDVKGSSQGTWVAFSDPEGIPKVKTRINLKKMTGTVTFKDWMLDPGVGWGFT